ncbi:hypothetical protein CNMCM5623_002470 [Aspergillus felis]|uniref:Cytochrome P450 n=1 Tax=Aspergillus felis TaxID=1287682 RepID=A0A8H6UZH9_9EURO|nr:hypothetical protein CNMCM5623_002470 [Aspergillus felis]
MALSIITNLSTLSTPALCGWLTALLAIWYVVTAIQTWYPLRHVPGPRLASFSYLWMLWNDIRGTNFEKYANFGKYGSLVRNGPRSLVTDDPEVLRKISGARSRYTRDEHYYSASRVEADRENMITILDTARHDAWKAKVASGYSGKENPDLEQAVDAQVMRLVDLIRRKYLSTSGNLRAVDFSLLSRYFTTDVVSRLGHGKAIGHLDEGEDVFGWFGDVKKLIVFLIATDIPWIRRVVMWKPLFRRFGPKPTDKRGIGRVLGYTRNIIAEHFEKDAEPHQDMFGAFIRRGLTKEQLEGEAVLQLVGGSDTTATAMRGVILHLATSPSAYNQLKAEIKEAISQGRASSPITLQEALKLPYLQAVIWEGFRMRTPVTWGHYKVVPPEGDTINGLFIPGGTAIGHNSLALARRKDIWGDDAAVFRPERWLECSAEKKMEMDRAVEIVFGGGRWMCAGKPIAVMELNKVFFEVRLPSHGLLLLLRVFDFALVNPVMPVKETALAGFVHTDMWMRFTEAKA